MRLKGTFNREILKRVCLIEKGTYVLRILFLRSKGTILKFGKGYFEQRRVNK